MLIVPPPPQSIIARATGVEVADAFSTDLYTGTGAALSITNGVDLDTNDGMVWIKQRGAATAHYLFDTVRGATEALKSNTTGAEDTSVNTLTAFNSDGYTLGVDSDVNNSSSTYVGWTFRQAAGFFDAVTYTGNGSARTIAHNLGAPPGIIIVKPTSLVGGWVVYHRANTGSPETQYLQLNGTGATATYSDFWNDTAPTSSVFSLGTDAGVNGNTHSYVAYLFGHDTGGIIQCGSYTGNGSATGPTITLGWETQFVMIKNSSNVGDWGMYDSARDASNPNTAVVLANASTAETASGPDVDFNSTSFQIKSTDADVNTNTDTYIYMAIKAE